MLNVIVYIRWFFLFWFFLCCWIDVNAYRAREGVRLCVRERERAINQCSVLTTNCDCMHINCFVKFLFLFIIYDWTLVNMANGCVTISLWSLNSGRSSAHPLIRSYSFVAYFLLGFSLFIFFYFRNFQPESQRRAPNYNILHKLLHLYIHSTYIHIFIYIHIVHIMII